MNMGSKPEQPRTEHDMTQESGPVGVSRKRTSHLIIIGVYLIVWALLVVLFWFVLDPDDAMGFALLAFYLGLPVTSLVLSVLIGKDSSWGRGRWLLSLFFAVMYMLQEYVTFSLANMLAFHKFNQPNWEALLFGLVPSLVGLAIGAAMRALSNRKT